MRKTSITTYDILNFHVRNQADQLALKQGSKTFSYRQWYQTSEHLAWALAARGVAEGDRVAVLTYNCVEQLMILLACMKLGAVYVPVNYRLAEQELMYVVNQSEAKIIFCDAPELCSLVDGIAAQTGLEGFVQVGETEPVSEHWQAFKELQVSGAGCSPPSTPFTPQPGNVVYQMYTSGTTGFPKGVLITQQQFANLAFSAQLNVPRPAPHTAHLVVAPMFHAAALVSSVLVLCSARSLVLLKEFQPVEFVEVLVQEKICDVVVVPAMLQAILHMVPDLGKYDFSHLEKIVYGASPITVDVLKAAMAVFKCGFEQGFGMTEMCASVTTLTVDDHLQALQRDPQLLRSCGRANVGVDVQVVNPESRQPLPIGEVGEIVVRAPYAMQGYSKQPDKTAEVLVDGWYYTGDGGYLDEAGYLYIKDRIKDMIVSGGENIYPAEVENALMSHPQIADVAVIGVPDDQYGDAALAVCVPHAEAEIDAEAMIEHCRPLIAGYKIPRRYEVSTQLPRNASGKLLKTKLRETFLT